MKTSSRLLSRIVPASVGLVLLTALGSACPGPAVEPGAPVVVPFRMLPSNHMLVEVKLNGEGPYRLIFDLGSPVTLIGSKAARESGVVDENLSGFALLFSNQSMNELETLTVGDLEAEDVPVMVMDHPLVGALGRILGQPIDGLVGHSFFARFKTTINYKTRKMTFEPVEAEISNFLEDLPERMMAPKRAERIVLDPVALFGLTLEDTSDDGDDGVTVVEVLANGPAAEAGIEPGDLLVELDGRWTTSVADTFEAASKIEVGSPTSAVVMRSGDRVELRINAKPGL